LLIVMLVNFRQRDFKTKKELTMPRPERQRPRPKISRPDRDCIFGFKTVLEPKTTSLLVM